MMEEPGRNREGFREIIVRLSAGRTFILFVFGAVVTLNLSVGEPGLMRDLSPQTLGGPLIEEIGTPAKEPDPPPSYDTLSANVQLVGAPVAGDALIRFGDTVGGAADPSGGILEWVAEDAEILTHVVKDGETVSDIAKIYGVSVETILWANGLTPSSTIKPGDELKFPSLSGVLHLVRDGETFSKIASTYGVSMERISAANRGVNASSLKPGQELIIPGGRPVQARTKTVSSSSPAQLPSTAGYFILPTTGLNWGRLHPVNAVDIANACGTPVWAAASGVVEWAGWDPKWYYGNYVVIRHPNGMKTYYTHLQTIAVGEGAPVTQGEVIGTIGNTGRTTGITGCHLHFEVRGGANPFLRYR